MNWGPVVLEATTQPAVPLSCLSHLLGIIIVIAQNKIILVIAIEYEIELTINRKILTRLKLSFINI